MVEVGGGGGGIIKLGHEREPGFEAKVLPDNKNGCMHNKNLILLKI